MTKIGKISLRTPLLPFQKEASGKSRIFLKTENLQPFGSYKIRGVENAIRCAEPEVLQQGGLCAASAGNMAQAAAFIARELGLPCRIYVPRTAPEIKKSAIRNLNAQLVELPFQEVWKMVREPASDLPGLFIHPVFTPGLTEGYAMIADEILVDSPDVDALVIPFGVGGLTYGIARRLRQLHSDIAVYACEPETAAPLNRSLREGRASSVDRTPSFVDAIGTPEVLPNVFDLVAPLIADSLVVSLDEIGAALRSLLIGHKLLCEGAAAASLAAALKLSAEGRHRNIVCILSGGNISQDMLKSLVF